MDKDELRAKLSERFNAPITNPVDELFSYLKQLWGHGDSDKEVLDWLSSRPPTLGDDRGLAAWEDVLEADVQLEDLRRLLYAAGNQNAHNYDSTQAKAWLEDRLDWVRSAW